MGRIACTHCQKTFRGENGLAWHLTRSHEFSTDSLDDDRDVDADGREVGNESLQSSLDALQSTVDALSENHNRYLELQHQILSIEEQLQAFREVSDKIQEDQSLRDQALEYNLAKAQELGRRGAKAQNNVLSLNTFLNEELLPALAAHSHEQLIRIYPDQETIDKLPRCTFCGSPKEDGHRTCGQLACVARVLSIPQNTPN